MLANQSKDDDEDENNGDGDEEDKVGRHQPLIWRIEMCNNWVSSKTLSTIITVVVQCDYCCWQLTVFLMIRPNCHSPNVALPPTDTLERVVLFLLLFIVIQYRLVFSVHFQS